jgi:phosphoribosylaminoimidazolecarboxamide formyltransferase/IMP cyclohydrolase
LHYFTGGTEDFIKNLGIPVIPLKMSYIIFLERVKTLHPKEFGEY